MKSSQIERVQLEAAASSSRSFLVCANHKFARYEKRYASLSVAIAVSINFINKRTC
jgi:hypothetical protein